MCYVFNVCWLACEDRNGVIILTKPSVLFVDDEAYTLATLERSMAGQSDQFEMAFCQSPEEALTLFRSRTFDVVVTDVVMPNMNGIELVIAMRQIQPNAKYILLTGAADLPMVMEAVNRAQIFRFFTKPCASAMLIEAIDAAIHAQKTLQSIDTLGAQLMDSLAAALLVVDASGRVQFMNQPARELGAAGDGISIGPDKLLRASSQAQTTHLHSLIRMAAQGQGGGGMSIQCQKSERILAAVIKTPSASRTPDLVAVYLRFPSDQGITSVEQLSSIFNLTPAESLIAHSLSHGLALVEAAALSGITIGTARNYLKRVFAKTGTSRQVELVNLILSYSSPFH